MTWQQIITTANNAVSAGALTHNDAAQLMTCPYSMQVAYCQMLQRILDEEQQPSEVDLPPIDTRELLTDIDAYLVDGGEG